MAFFQQWDRYHANVDELKNSKGNISVGGTGEKLTRAQKRERRIKQHLARQSWRNYGEGYMSYFSIVFTETMVSIFAVWFYALFVVAFVVGILGLAFSSHLMGTLIFGGAFAAILTPPLRRLVKRRRFVKRLDKACKQNGFKLYRYRSALTSLYKSGGVPDFAVETGDSVYECMFYPAPRRLSVLRFDKPGEVCVVTGIVRNRFKEVLGMNDPRARVKPFGFDSNTKITTKKLQKVVLLNPVPYELYYFDKKDGKTVQGGSGTQFFDYIAYSGSGFINTIKRGH